MSGKLFVCATPIGNLQDVTLRLLSVLGSVHVIAAEDTRHTRKLLSHHGISRPLVSYHEHNKRQAGDALIQRLLAGEDVALVTDAGVPAVSDPGNDLVAEAASLGIAVVPVPGPSALTAALSVSGLATDEFTFVGFLPRGKKRMVALLEEFRAQNRALVAYESPKRLRSSLEVMAGFLVDRRICVTRELTKVHEEVFRGTVSEAKEFFSGREVLGEITLVLEGARADRRAETVAADVAKMSEQQAALDDVMRRVKGGAPLNEAVREVARETGLKRNDLYRVALERKRDQ
jgi:16S rRNA (cytidine1402-2'-O)-methyltransferase